MKNFLRVGLAIILLVSLYPLTHWFVHEASGVEIGTYSWPMFHKNNRRMGFSISSGPLTNSTRWIQTLNESIVRSSPAVVDGRVFVGGYREVLYAYLPSSIWCLNETTGAVIWRYQTGSCVTSSPTVADGRVFVGSWDGKIYCLNETTGAEIWRYTTGAGIFSSPVVDHMVGVTPPNRVFVGSMDGVVYCLNEDTGSLIWQTPTGDAVESSPAVFENKVFIGSNDHIIYCLNESTGLPIWKNLTGGAVRSTPSIGIWWPDKLVSVGSDDGYVYHLFTNNGTVHWISPHLGGAIVSSPAIRTHENMTAVDCVWVGSTTGSVYRLLEPSGTVAWNKPLPLGYTSGLSSSPALSGLGYLYIGHATSKTPPGVEYGAVYCLDMENGDIQWTYNTGALVTSSPAVADGMVFVGDKNGKVYCFGSALHNVDAISVWQHMEEHGFDWDIWYSVWDEGYGWWTPAGLTAAPIARLGGNDCDPNISFNRKNQSICVWAHYVNETLDYDIWFSKWSDPLANFMWTYAAPVASIIGSDFDPAIAFDTNGWAIAVWVHEYPNGTRVIFYSLWNGTDWIGPAGPLVPLPDNWPTAAAMPEITFTATNGANPKFTPHQAVAIWVDIDLTMYYSAWDGSAWTTPAIFGGQAPPSWPVQNPAVHRIGISSDKLGNAIAVWATKDLDNRRPPVYYAIWNGTAWTPQTILNNSHGIMPAIAFNATNDAIADYTAITLKPPDLIFQDIWYSQYVGTWQPEAIAAHSGWDGYGFWRPAIAFLQSNKSITVWWTNRPDFAPGEIFYTVWNGSWTQPEGIVPAPGLPGNDTNPAIASPSGSPTMPLSVLHDIAVTGVKVDKTVVGQGFSAKVYVNVTNQGGVTEPFDVTTFANTTSIQTKTLTLTSGNSTTITFSWNTTGSAKGNYSISAYAWPVPGETDTTDNKFTDGWVIVAMVGDITGPQGLPDGKVDMRDVSAVAKLFGVNYPDSRYNPNYDINNDLKIDMKDVSIVAREFGKTDL